MCTRTKRKWSDENTALLIELYATYGVPLWNTYISSKDRNAKVLMAMQKICVEMRMKGFDDKEVKQKIMYIRTRYKYELSKMSKDGSYQPAAKWFKKVDSFLRPHVNLSYTKEAPKTPKKDIPQHSPIKRKLPPEMRNEEQTPKRTVKEPTTSESENPFDIFGKCIAAQLKVLPRRTAIEIQFKIQAMLTDQTLILEDYDESGNPRRSNIPQNGNIY